MPEPPLLLADRVTGIEGAAQSMGKGTIWTETDVRADSWYLDVAKKTYRPAVYMQAAKALIAEGKAKESDFPMKTDGFKGVQDGFIDGITYDGRKPNEYLGKFKIGLKPSDAV